MIRLEPATYLYKYVRGTEETCPIRFSKNSEAFTSECLKIGILIGILS